MLFLSGLFFLFQVDVANEINKIASFDSYVAFTVPYKKERGKHWTTPQIQAEHIHCACSDMTEEQQGIWAESVIKDVHPDILLLGFCRGIIYEKARKASALIGAKYGFWFEPPNFLRPRLRQWVSRYIIRHITTKRVIKGAKFALAIGDRAEDFYKSVLRKQDVYLIPYGEDLSLHFQIKRTAVPEKTHFLFSGQLVKRHNIQLIANALIALHKRRSGQFKFIVAGFGPEERVIQLAMERCPGLKSHIAYDRDYTFWEDRVRPFSYSDVLVYPSLHSGWGLVVPEAMAAGMVVISTRKVEAARYYIKNRVNGILIEPTLEQLLTQMEWCIDNKDRVLELGQQARIDAQAGTATTVAKQFCEVVQPYL